VTPPTLKKKLASVKKSFILLTISENAIARDHLEKGLTVRD
jgi:hypothetical protein